MIVSCENCGARYKLDPGRIKGRGVRITCPRCKHVFVVYRQQAEATGEVEPAEDSGAGAAPASSSAPAAGAPGPEESGFEEDEATQIFTRASQPGTRDLAAAAAKPAKPAAAKPAAAKPAKPAGTGSAPGGERGDVSDLDFASVGISAWKVKVRIGLVYDFSDYKTLAKYIKDGRVDQDDKISHDGQEWTRLGDIDDLEEHFFLVFEQAEARMAAGDLPAEEPVADPESVGGRLAAASGSGADTADSYDNGDEDDDLAATMAAAAAAEDESYGGGGDGPSGPTFNDPFARQRERRSNGQRRRQPKAQKPDKKRSPLPFILIGAIAAGALIAVGISGMNESGEPLDEARQQQQQELAKKQIEKQAEDYRKEQADRLADEIRGTLDPEDPGQDGFTVEGDPEEVLTPVGPRGPVGATNGTAGMQVSGGAATAPATRSAADHYSAGRSAMRTGSYSTAAASFRQALALEPNNAGYRSALGLALMEAGQLDDARTELVAAVNKGSVEAHEYLGDIAARQGDVAGAVGHYNAYAQRSPGDQDRIQAKIDRLLR